MRNQLLKITILSLALGMEVVDISINEILNESENHIGLTFNLNLYLQSINLHFTVISSAKAQKSVVEESSVNDTTISNISGDKHSNSKQSNQFLEITARITENEFDTAKVIYSKSSFSKKERETLEKIILSEVKPIPASQIQLNLDGYGLLLLLDSNNKLYKQKVGHYQSKVDALRKKKSRQKEIERLKEIRDGDFEVWATLSTLPNFGERMYKVF